MRWQDYLKVSVPIVIAALSPLAIDQAQANDWTIREQWGLGIAILIVCLVAQWAIMRYEEKADILTLKRDAVERILNTVIERGTTARTPLDPIGDLEIRMNVMVPYRRLLGRWYVPAYDRPARDEPHEDVVFHMYACSLNSKGRSSLWVGWEAGRGNVGQLWVNGDHIRLGAIPEGADVSEFNLTEQQKRHTRDTRCVISVALTEGIGPELWRRGILNVSSSNEDAITAWSSTEPEEEIDPEVASYLVELAHEIVRLRLLPGLRWRHRDYLSSNSTPGS